MLTEVEPRLTASLPPGHYAFAMVALLRARLAQAAGNLPLALVRADRSLSMLEANAKAGRQDGSYIPVVLLRRSDIERELGRLPEAESDARRATKLIEQHAEPGVPSGNIGLGYLRLGQALAAEGRTADAQGALETAVHQLEPAMGASHPATRQAMALVASTMPSH